MKRDSIKLSPGLADIKGELMKTAWYKLMRNEKGQALPIVLVLLLIGSLFTAPLLGYMGTGLIAGQVFEKKMAGLYAADAGVEDALWKLLNGSYSPPHNLTDVNGMNVTVEQVGVPVDPGDGTLLYTLKSTAYLGGEPKAEIIAQVETVTEGAVVAGGTGGAYKTNEETVALSLINEDTIIFATQTSSEFWGREDDPSEPGTDIEREDLGLVNMATGIGRLYLDGDALGLLKNPKYEFYSVHYYQEGVNDYLLMSIQSTAFVGANEFTRNDIIILQVVVDYSDPDYPVVTAATSDPAPLHNIPGADISALSRRDGGAFSLPDVGDEFTITDGIGGDSGTITVTAGSISVTGTGTWADPDWSTTAGQTIIVTAAAANTQGIWTATTETATAAITTDSDGDATVADGTILFSFSNPSVTLGGTEFNRGEVIKLDISDPGNPVYERYFDAKYILPGNPNLELDVLAVLPAPDQRLLLSFTDDSGVTGSNGAVIEAEDLAIWDMGPDLTPNTADDTINLHISMSGMALPGPVTTVNIVSWEVNS